MLLLRSFVHKAPKDEQIECIHRIVCHGRDVLAVLPTGLGKSTIYQLISKGPYSQRHIKTAAELLVFCWLTKWNGIFTKFCFWNLLITNETGGRVLQNKPYFCRPYCTALHVNSRCSCLPAHDAASGNFAWFILIWRWHRRHCRWQIF